ncbi:hypothetical protein [Candidatus Uabimicrobium amorphum]|uniref:PDZ domain-containing protein n=1 Tax=Uabimicrobium amorphum TaxID=2596890 RepID=A0A5S9IIC5_UABAM|nr:hypothetical protein [Candidatus Uabimicrobium amorphum]BBM81922.1 hypothetical protein UABAM_00264 [Candidatus Uabimicrobium amorphum]
MPIKTIKKMIWLASSFFSLLLCGALFMVFFISTVDAQKVPKLPPEPQRNNSKKTTLIQLSALWKTDFNAKQPVRQVVRVTQQPVRQAPKLESILPRYLQIHSILNEGFAIVILNRRQKMIMRPFDQKAEDTFLDLGDESQRPWEVSIPGKKLILIKIDYEQGILFQNANDEKEQGWLKPSKDGGFGRSVRKIPKSRQIGENQWMVTRDEARKMYEEYDKYIGEMALKPHNDGIWVRRVPEGSKAAFYGLQKNDIVVDFNGTPLKLEELSSKNNIRKMARKYRKMKSFRLNIIRNGQKMTLRFDKP